MKKSILLFLSIFLLTFIACDNSTDETVIDDDQGQSTGDPTVDNVANFQNTGSSANDILSNTNFDRILVEIAFVEGFRPTQSATDAFEEFLQEFTFKENIDLVFTSLPSPGEEDLTLQEISDIEIENRTVYNDGSTLGIYIYFADASSENDDEDEDLVTLGAVYRNTSMVIYENTLRRFAGGTTLITLADIEIATLNHEFGHLLGLVNLGTVAINNHEDTTTDDDGNIVGNNHCNVEGCLMQAQLNFNLDSSIQNTAFNTAKDVTSACTINGHVLLEQLMSNAASGSDIVPVLDPECRLDLGGNGGRPSTDS